MASWAIALLATLGAGCGLDMTGAKEVQPVGTVGASIPLEAGATPGVRAPGPAQGGADGGDPVDPGVPDGGPSSESCAPTLTCAAAAATAARDIGSLAADVGTASVKAAGATSTFLRVRLLETVFADAGLRAKLTLTSPPGANYDLFVYYDESENGSSRTECTKLKASSTTADGVDTVSIAWTDQQPVGGHEDSANVTVEVRFVSGACSPGAEWNLLVQGNAR